MDFAFSFTPNDLEDVTKREARSRVNPKIVLTMRLGKGFLSTGLPVLLEDMSFVGRLRCVSSSARTHSQNQIPRNGCALMPQNQSQADSHLATRQVDRDFVYRKARV
jgi:hypothetical protein